MPGPIFSNNASGTLASNYSSAATAITLTGGQGALFPAPGAGEWFMATITNAVNAIEIVRCTSRAGDTMQVLRGQEGTAARALATGDKIENRLTAGALKDIKDQPADPTLIPDLAIKTRMLDVQAVDSPQIKDRGILAGDIAQGQITNYEMAPGAALANLGYTPVQQGGGFGQLTNKVFIGWTPEAKLGLTVDASGLGYILTERQSGDTNSAGYRSMYPTAQNNDYTFGIVDDGRGVYHNGPTQTYIVPPDSTPFQVGAVIHIVNFHSSTGPVNIVAGAGVLLVAIPGGVNGNRQLVPAGVATIEKVSSNEWYIYGAGLI